MTKEEKLKIASQIKRLCEKQYRKGFQQGYESYNDDRVTSKKVRDFRSDGACENYSIVKSIHSNRVEKGIERIEMEMGMVDMKELRTIIFDLYK